MIWTANLIDDPGAVAEIVRQSRRIAVLGIKPESHAQQPAHYVPAYMARAGCEILPVPVYYPDVTHILGQPVVRKLTDVSGEIDMVNVFRRPQDIDQHVEEILAARPKFVWFQSGIRNEAAARQFAEAGIKVVQDHCLMVEHGRAQNL